MGDGRVNSVLEGLSSYTLGIQGFGVGSGFKDFIGKKWVGWVGSRAAEEFKKTFGVPGHDLCVYVVRDKSGSGVGETVRDKEFVFFKRSDLEALIRKVSGNSTGSSQVRGMRLVYYLHTKNFVPNPYAPHLRIIVSPYDEKRIHSLHESEMTLSLNLGGKTPELSVELDSDLVK